MFGRRKSSRFAPGHERLPKSFREAYQLQIEEQSGKLGLEAVRMLFLLNGGALVALLTLLGNLAGKPSTPPIDIQGALVPFGWGLASVAGAVLAFAAHTTTWTAVSLKAWMREDIKAQDVAPTAVLVLLGGALLCASLGCALWGFTRAVGVYDDAVVQSQAAPQTSARPAASAPQAVSAK